MSWKDNLLNGSFRDVPFKVEGADAEVGRRVALHEYPLRDKPYAEDLGRKARRFSLDLYVIGADYMAVRDRLIAAFEKSGPGKLVHPWLGQMTATAVEVRGPRESTREGGMARFSVTLVESGEKIFPSAKSSGALTDAAADTAKTAIQADFANSFDITGRPQFVIDHAENLVEQAADKLDELRKGFPAIPAKVTAFISDLQHLSSSVEALVRAPADLAVDVYELVTDLAALPDRVIRAFDAYEDLFGFLSDAPKIGETTANRSRMADNQQAFAAFVRRSAVAEAARTASAMTFDSYDDALALRDAILDQVDVELYGADNDAVYKSLSDLRAGLVRDMAAGAADLARLASYVPPVTTPALVIAHRLYDDPSRDAEIIARNRIRHPGFVTGGTALEVLTDA